MLRIAIIDDLSADRAVLREALERELAPRGAAFTIEEFASGEEFTAAFVPRRYDAAYLHGRGQRHGGRAAAVSPRPGLPDHFPYHQPGIYVGKLCGARHLLFG